VFANVFDRAYVTAVLWGKLLEERDLVRIGRNFRSEGKRDSDAIIRIYGCDELGYAVDSVLRNFVHEFMEIGARHDFLLAGNASSVVLDMITRFSMHVTGISPRFTAAS
jgi:hypothetical protein